MRNFIVFANCSLTLSLVYGFAGGFPAAAAEPALVHRDRKPFDKFQDSVRLATRARDDLSILNQERLEDFKDFNRLPILAKQIKPYCQSLLNEVFPLPEVPVEKRLPPGLKSLWMQAAAQPETELQLQAAQAIERASHLTGADFTEAIPLLVELLEAEDTERVVRQAAARALLALDARDAAPVLRRHAATGLDLAQLIEPGLADWNDRPMHSVWLSRLDQGTAPPGLLMLAIQAAAKIELAAAASHLRRHLLSVQTPRHLRLEAAKVLGHFADPSVIADARHLTSAQPSRNEVLNHLLAAYLLTRQTSDEAVALLQQLAVDREPAVAALAFKSLLKNDPALVQPALEQAVQSPDPGLRTLAAEALFLLPVPENVLRLSGFLGDRNFLVRSTAQERLVESDAIAELSGSVRQSVMDLLNSGSPRGIAQAAIIAGQLDDEPSAERLVQQLEHDDPDVSIAAAWALRRLAVPETAEPILRYLTAQTEKSLVEIPIESNADLSWTWTMYEQQKHLIEALGLLKFRPAESLFRQYVPAPLGKPLNHPFHWVHCTRRGELRARAIWALGRLQDESSAAELAPLLSGRLEDAEENVFVSAAGGLSLGEMKAAGAENLLETFYVPEAKYTEASSRASILNFACRQALESLTGQSLPPLEVEPYVIPQTGWFLEPLSDDP